MAASLQGGQRSPQNFQNLTQIDMGTPTLTILRRWIKARTVQGKTTKKRTQNTRNEQRLWVFLSQRYKNGCLNKGVIDEAATFFSFKRRMIQVTGAAAPVAEALPEACKLRSKVQGTQDMAACIVCGDPAMAAHYCLLCNYIVHAVCGDPEENKGYGKPVKCFQCRSTNNIQLILFHYH